MRICVNQTIKYVLIAGHLSIESIGSLPSANLQSEHLTNIKSDKMLHTEAAYILCLRNNYVIKNIIIHSFDLYQSFDCWISSGRWHSFRINESILYFHEVETSWGRL